MVRALAAWFRGRHIIPRALIAFVAILAGLHRTPLVTVSLTFEGNINLCSREKTRGLYSPPFPCCVWMGHSGHSTALHRIHLDGIRCNPAANSQWCQLYTMMRHRLFGYHSCNNAPVYTPRKRASMLHYFPAACNPAGIHRNQSSNDPLVYGQAEYCNSISLDCRALEIVSCIPDPLVKLSWWLLRMKHTCCLGTCSKNKHVKSVPGDAWGSVGQP